MRLSFLPIIVVLFVGPSAHATRYHVSIGANGPGTGLTWVNAFTDLQEALSIVVPGDEIWVAAGQYKPTTGTSRTISFQIRNGVNMYGGFAGFETALDQRDIAANPTVLNGDIGQPGSSADNSYTVVTANQLTIPTELDGFRIMNGYSNSGTAYNGGGMRITNTLGGRLTVRNCMLANNYSGDYGGGVYLAAAKVTFENCDFNNNSAGTGGDGGAIYNGNNNGGYSHLEIHNSRFKNNTARRGACIHGGLDFDPLIIDRCIFTGNTSELSILEFDGFTSASFTNSLIVGNVVNDTFARVFRILTSSVNKVMTIGNCTFAHNYNLANAPQSTMIFVYGTHHRIFNSIVHGNTPYNGRQVSAGMTIDHSIVEGGHLSGTNIIDLDPLFTAPYAGPQANFDASGYDYHPLFASPAINAGNDAHVPPAYGLDLMGATRIQGGAVDLGCYESELSVSTGATTNTPISWYFDMERNELHLLDPAPLQGEAVEVFDLGGKLRARITPQQQRTRIELPAGAYVARCNSRPPLKFVFAGR